MIYDVIVVGAGPSGSTMARECASRGLDVLLIDKASFPRDKPCGGGVNLRAARLLPFDLEPVIERRIHGIQVTIGGGDGFTRRSPTPLSYLTQRRCLDSFLMEQALRAGVTFRDQTPIRSIDHEGANLTVRSGNSAFSGRVVVAADGANGLTSRLVGMDGPRWRGIALEANISPDAFPRRWDDVFAIDSGQVPGGYGWLFPKGDHLNVGVGGWNSAGPLLRKSLDALTRMYGLDPGKFWGLRGHPLPVRRPGAPLVARRALAVGDAAGLLDPLTGEGIYAAFWSGIAAARHVKAFLSGTENSLQPYAREVESVLGRELRVAVQLRDLFHASPRLFTGALGRSQRIWDVVCNLLTGDETYLAVKERSWIRARAIDLVADAIRLRYQLSNRADAADLPGPEGFLRHWAPVQIV